MKRSQEQGLSRSYGGRSIDPKGGREKRNPAGDRKFAQFNDPQDFPFGWQKTFDASLDIFVLISRDFEIIKVNKAASESLGKRPEDLVGKKCYEVVHGLDSPIEGCPCEKSIETERAGEGQFEDHGLHFIATAAPIFDENDELIAFAHTVKNITDIKKAAEKLQEANELLEHRVEERTAKLKSANKRLIEAIEKRRLSEQALKKSEARLREQAKELEKKNIALSEIIAQIEIEKQRIKDGIQANIEKVVFPLLQKQKFSGNPEKCAEVVQFHLKQISSAYGCVITNSNFKLTSRELEICSMIKAGLSSKEMSSQLNISKQTVDKHRRNIRAKLGITNFQVNLVTFLRDI